VVGDLPSKCEALSSNPVLTKKVFSEHNTAVISLIYGLNKFISYSKPSIQDNNIVSSLKVHIVN
jgi:hypothetical protein